MAEDNEGHRDQLKLALKELDMLQYCEFAENGADAVDLFTKRWKQEIHISHIITDFMMPKENGIQAIKKITAFLQNQKRSGKHSEHPDPLIIFVTEHNTPTFKSLVHSLPIHAIFDKPVKLEELKSIF